MNKEQICDRLQEFMNGRSVEDTILKSFIMEITSPQEQRIGPMLLFFSACIGYCDTHGSIMGVDFGALDAKTIAENEEISNKIKDIYINHDIGIDFRDSAAELANGLGNSLMSNPFVQWGDIIRTSVVMAYEIGRNSEETSESKQENNSEPDSFLDDNLANDLRSILGDNF